MTARTCCVVSLTCDVEAIMATPPSTPTAPPTQPAVTVAVGVNLAPVVATVTDLLGSTGGKKS